jgi:hypothetical protein
MELDLNDVIKQLDTQTAAALRAWLTMIADRDKTKDYQYESDPRTRIKNADKRVKDGRGMLPPPDHCWLTPRVIIRMQLERLQVINPSAGVD